MISPDDEARNMQAFLLVLFLVSFGSGEKPPVGAVRSVLAHAPVDLGDLLLDYDRRLRPLYAQRSLTLTASIEQIFAAQWTDNKLQINFELRQTWTDTRLQFKGKTPLVIRDKDIDLIWTPDTIFASALSAELKNKGAMELSPDGSLHLSQTHALLLVCPISLTTLLNETNGDTCEANLELRSYWHSKNELQYIWKAQKMESESWPNPIQGIQLSDGLAAKLHATLTVNTGITKQVAEFILRKALREL